MRSASVRLQGHPDHVCDMVVESIVDEYTRRDPESRVNISAIGGRGVLFVSGDVLSEADFDVSSLVTRTLGTLGVVDSVEPFISLEPVSAERVPQVRLSSEKLVVVTGYATAETDTLMPATVLVARRIAKRLEEKRAQDPAWFWLGPDGEVTVFASQMKPDRIVLLIEHGQESLEHVRQLVTAEIFSMLGEMRVDVSSLTSPERRGFGELSGATHRGPSVYGSLLPSISSSVGRDAHTTEKAGAWIARAAARSLVKRGARAALVHVAYEPGEREPMSIAARDERGKDLSGVLNRGGFRLDRVMDGWWRAGLHADAARWGGIGEIGMPWED